MANIPFQPQYPDINGQRFDFSSVQIRVPGIFQGPSPVGINGLMYSDNMEPGEVRGNSPLVLGRSRGQYKAKASLKIYKIEMGNLMMFLDELGLLAIDGDGNPTPQGYKEVAFDWICSYAGPGQPVRTDQIVGCRITEDVDDYKSGQDPLLVTVSLNPIYLIKAGVAPFQPDQALWSGRLG